MTPVDPRVPLDLLPADCSAHVIAKDQTDEYIPLPAIITPNQRVITRWALTDEERQKLLDGDDLYLTIWGTPIRPVMLSVGTVNWKELE